MSIHDDYTEQFAPESVDEQIRRMAAVEQQPGETMTPDERLITDLRMLYGEYAETRDRVWARLVEHVPAQAPQLSPVEAEVKDLEMVRKQERPRPDERRRNMQQKSLRSFRLGLAGHRLAQVAAAFVVIILVGSLIGVFEVIHHGGNGTWIGGDPGGSTGVSVTPPPFHQDCTMGVPRQVNILLTGWSRVCMAHELQQIQQSKTFEGKTLTIETAYIDGNQVLVQSGLTPFNSSEMHSLTLFEQYAMPKRLVIKSGQQLLDSAIDFWFDPTTRSFQLLASFDITELSFSANQGPLPLHLIVPVVRCTEIIPNTPAVTGTRVPVAHSSPMATDTQAQPQCKQSTTVSFDFSAPFHAARIANINRTVMENGIPITLKSARVSSTQTVIQVITPSTAGIPNDGRFFSVTVGNLQVKDSWSVSYLDQGTIAELTVLSSEPLFDKYGQWALNISHLAKPGGKTDWVFHFTVPPVQSS